MIMGLLTGFGGCLLYLSAIGIAFFLIGRILPKKWFCANRFPYRSFRFEHEGKIYNRLKIRTWQNKVPDMSRIFSGLMPPKKLTYHTLEKLPLLIQETSVAECIHLLLCFAGLYCIRIWNGYGGVVISILYFLGNVPFILIQRYNRPRLQQLLQKQFRNNDAAGAKSGKGNERNK